MNALRVIVELGRTVQERCDSGCGRAAPPQGTLQHRSRSAGAQRDQRVGFLVVFLEKEEEEKDWVVKMSSLPDLKVLGGETGQADKGREEGHRGDEAQGEQQTVVVTLRGVGSIVPSCTTKAGCGR